MTHDRTTDGWSVARGGYMPEVGDAHASEDCAVSCQHPDHLYVGDSDFWDLQTLMDLREMAQRNSWHLTDVLSALSTSDPEGPVVL